MPTIAQNIHRLNQQIVRYVSEMQRNSNDVQLLAVSKGQSSDRILEAYNAGLRRFGENYLQEALEKQQALQQLSDIEWHFIGPLQSNKTRKVAEHFHWVHSVDRLSIAQRLSTQRPNHLPPLNICLQVNIDSAASKSGFSLESLMEAAPTIAELPMLQLRGLMAIPDASDSLEKQRQPFAALAKCRDQLQQQLQQQGCNITLDTLSIGMSRDMAAAIYEGATLVRIGTALFGPRNTAQ